MPTDNRVRITIDWQGQRLYFLRMDGDRPEIVPADRIRIAALMSREVAVAVRNRLRETGWLASVVTPEGVTLYERETAHSPVAQATSPEPMPMQCNGVLIVPGMPPRGGFWIRFPGSAIESLWGDTAENAYQRLVTHSQAAKLMPLAEKYAAPQEHIVTPAEVQAALQKERNRNLRPGDR